MANEKRLIDANTLLDLLRPLQEVSVIIKKVLSIIRNCPTVDAVEVVHGRWIEKKLDDFRMWELRCSECGWVGISNYDAYDEPFDFNYCPNCGAKMDGGNEDG